MSIKGNPKYGLSGATIAFFVGFAAVALFGPTAVKFKEAMHLSAISSGFLIAMPMLSGSLLRIPFGAWGGKDGGFKPIILLLILSAIGLGGIALLINVVPMSQLTIHYYPLLLILALLSGCGIASFTPGVSQVSFWYPQKKQGWALAAFAGYGNLAPGIFSFLIPFAMASIGLHGAYLVWFAFLLVGILLYWKLGCNAWYFQYLTQGKAEKEAYQLATNDGQEIFPSGTVLTRLLGSCKKLNTWLFVIMYFTTFGGFLALTAWLPTYWHFGYNLEKSAGVITGLFAIISSLIRVQGGILSDRIGGFKTANVGLMSLVIGSILMAVIPNLIFQILGLLLIAIGMGVNSAAVFKMIPQYSPNLVAGTSALVGGLGALGGFVLPPIMSWLDGGHDINKYPHVFWIFFVLAIVSLLCNFIVAACAKKNTK